MSLLGKYTENSSKRATKERYPNTSEYKEPAVIRETNDGSISFKKAMVISSILHPASVFILWLVLAILALLGIKLSLFNPPKPKVNDIEFVLVDHEDTPRDMNTKNRADMNSRSGGINDPKRPVSMPSAPAAPKIATPGGGNPKKSLIDRIKPSSTAQKPQSQPKANTTTQKNVTPSPTVTQAIPKPQAARPQPPTERPSVRPPMSNPKTVQKPSTSPFKIPVPSGGTTSGQYATGPISGSGTSKNGGSSGSGNYSPNPSLAPVGNGGSRTASKGTGAGTGSGSGGGGGNGTGGGNPGGGGGRPGIDAIKEPDFGPYMRELQRRIKMSWDPPKGNESKRVVLLFKIAKDGRLLSCSVLKSSGLQNADKAALNAVHLAAPFRPLPAEYKGQSIDIQFTFDYNVFAAKY